MDARSVISAVGQWSVTDKLAAGALAVATISLLLSAVPAVTSIFAAIAAWQTHKAERRGAEPAINVTIINPVGWPVGYLILLLSVTNDSAFFIEMRKARLISPRRLKIAFAPASELDPRPPPPVEPQRLQYKRTADLGATLVRPKGLPDPNRKDFRLVVASPEDRGKTTLRMRVAYARHNRDLKSTSIPIHVVVQEHQWRAQPLDQ